MKTFILSHHQNGCFGKLDKSTNIIPRTQIQIQIQIHIVRAKFAWSYHNYYSKAKPYIIVGHEHIHVCMLYIHNNKIYMCTEIHGNSIQPLKQE